MKAMLEILKSLKFKTPIDQILTELQQVLQAYLEQHAPSAVRRHDIVLVGGGSGSAAVGRSLLSVGVNDFTLLANVTDTLRDKETRRPVGAGILKQEYSIPDVVDITKQLLHTATSERRTELHLFLEQKPSEAMRIGYLVLAALYRELGDLQKAIQVLTEVLGNSYDVLAVTTAITELYLKDGQSGEFIDLYAFAQCNVGPPTELKLQPSAKLAPAAAEALLKAKHIIIGPGDLHFSVLPHFLVGGFRETLVTSSARAMIIANLTTRDIDTPGFTLARLLDVYRRYLPQNLSCDVLVHTSSTKLPNELPDDVEGTTYGQFQLLRADVASTNTNNNQQYVHDERKLGDVLVKQFLRGQR